MTSGCLLFFKYLLPEVPIDIAKEQDGSLKTHSHAGIPFQILGVDKDGIRFSDDAEFKFVDPFLRIRV